MAYTKEIEQLRESLVRNYVEALNTLSVDPLLDGIHPDFKYMLYGCFGIGTELRYLGFLYKCFAQMKCEGKSLNAELIWVADGTYKFPAVKLHPPIDLRIFYQDEWYSRYGYRLASIEQEVVLYIRIKENKIFRVLCYDAKTIASSDWLHEMNKPTKTIIYIDTYNDEKQGV